MKALLICLLAAMPSAAALRGVKVLERADVLAGKPFGAAGPYERIAGKAHFTVDPRLPANRIVTDLRHAPTNAEGLVEFSADIYILKPRDPARGNGTILFEVSNRGGKGLLSTFNYGTQAGEGMGNGFLLTQGYTLVWVGWQFDVEDRPGALRLTAPVALGIGGLVRAQKAITEKAAAVSVADRNHAPYPAADPMSLKHQMTVRDYGDGPRKVVPRDRWRFTDPVTVGLDGGFQPGRIYEIVYTSKDPAIAGLGPAAIRDFVAFLKYGGGPADFLGDQRRHFKRAIAFGSSQSGRFLRTYLYQGFNVDEQGRQVFDGLMPHIAGAARGSFTHRFAQPSLLGAQLHSDLFPFRDLPETDPETGVSDSILRIAAGTNTIPKIIYTNTANEYWRSSASLIHTSLDGVGDAALAPTTRVYFLTGCQHGSAAWPPSKNPGLLYSGNTLEYRPILRALLAVMNDWVTSGKEPPPSRFPTNAAAQLVAPGQIQFPKIPGFRMPVHVWQARRLDYGPGYVALGVIMLEPPRIVGKAFGVRLPQIDVDGNELGGVRNPVHSVPLGTHLGWNLSAVPPHDDTEMANLTGSHIPFPGTRAERERTGDARLSVEERYRGREDYLQRVEAAANQLAADRLLLPEDLPRMRERASAEWDAVGK